MSCVWLLPEIFVETGAAEELLYEVSAHVETLRVPSSSIAEVAYVPSTRMPPSTRSSGPRPAWAMDRFGSTEVPPASDAAEHRRIRRANTPIADRMLTLLEDRIPASPLDPLASVLESSELRGKVLVVRAWQEPDPAQVGAIAVRFAALAKDSRLSPTERVRLLVLARERDIATRSLERLDPMTAKVHWWWGAIGRLDTAVTVATARPHRGGSPGDLRSSFIEDHLIDEMVTEIAGPDLVLAQHLVSRWDGRMVSLPTLIDAHIEDGGKVAEQAEEWHGRPATPPRQLRDAWNRGLADLWDGEVRLGPAVHPRSLLPRRLDQHLWRGQNRALTPVVDRLRARLEHKIRSTARPKVLEALLAEEDLNARAASTPRPVLELGKMTWAVRNGLVRLSHTDTKLLYCLRDVRNALAHLSPLDDDTVTRLAVAISNSPARDHEAFG